MLHFHLSGEEVSRLWEMPRSCWRVYVVLGRWNWDVANGFNRDWFTNAKIAHETGLSVHQVKVSKTALRRSGLLTDPPPSDRYVYSFVLPLQALVIDLEPSW